MIGLQDGRRHEPAPLATALGVGRAPVARFQASFRKATRVPAPAARNWGGRRRALLTPNEEKPFLAPLVALSGGKKVSVRLAERLAIVLLAAQGEENIALAAGWKITRQKAARWRDRSAPQGSKGIDMDAPRSGRIPRISSANKKRGVQRTLQEKPAAASGLRDSTIGRIWKGHGLKPHLSRTFQRSNDQQFTEKLAAIGGRYLNPPEHAGGGSGAEKSQIQALDRTQPGLPLKAGARGHEDP